LRWKESFHIATGRQLGFAELTAGGNETGVADPDSPGALRDLGLIAVIPPG